MKVLLRGFVCISVLAVSSVITGAHAKVIDSHVQSTGELEHGLVLYQFYQNEYFDALVEQAYAEAINNPQSKSNEGELLKGGLKLSFGMADDAKVIFDRLLASKASEITRNRAWYYLAKFYYNKSDLPKSAFALSKIQGKVPKELNFDYRYLSTIVKTRTGQKISSEDNIDQSLVGMPNYPYLLFNTAIGQLKSGNLVAAVKNLEKVAAYDQSPKEEYVVLSDRAKLGLSQLAMQKGRFADAWKYLTQIRTTGLYSNRALLNYAWAAIKIKRFPDAIAALQLLNRRDISSPEVQESKVLLAHLYEQEGSPRKALKANLLSIKDFKSGVQQVAIAREIIAKKDVPEELITNIEAIIDDTDWNSAQPNVDYKNLTPFLMDLMASTSFNETLKELGDLYFLRKNLLFWKGQALEHLVIIDNSTKKAFDDKSKMLIETSGDKHQLYSELKSELGLMSYTLGPADQRRMDVLLDSTEKELKILERQVEMFGTLEKVYTFPTQYRSEVAALHKRIDLLLNKTERDIVKLEPIMRRLVNAELDKHEERMNYYMAQSRLAKARLYDTTLSTLRDAQRQIQEEE